VTYTLLPGTRAPVRVWTDPWAIEPGAAQQLRNIGTLPWVEGVAVMPDVHYGKGPRSARSSRCARPSRRPPSG
jgi:tRNA-splicing ligase RtcB